MQLNISRDNKSKEKHGMHVNLVIYDSHAENVEFQLLF